MSLGSLNTALGSFHNENVLTLARINFDFSLFKVEAPKEFDGLGASLSTQRRKDAEDGTFHQTARKLGALFEQLLPPIPALVKAYGQRVSEISRSPTANPPASWADGVFTNQVGADGTAIWAAATSGSSAIAVNLLACMLARIWPGPEAISVWVELVAGRKREIETSHDSSDASNLSTVAAARQELTRDQLARWDASARAWIRAADEAKKKNQQQLMLIIYNVAIPVSNVTNVYQSVIRAWISSMNAMENLIKGMPQRVQDGAILLCLSAWHLYPDMVVLGSTTTEVEQKDPLLAPGGCLTIGLENSDSSLSGGVYWSLSLAHLRYYGEPIQRSRSIGGDSSRIPFEDFTLAALGSVFIGLGAHESRILAGAKFFTTLWSYLIRKTETEMFSIEKSLAQVILACSSSWMNVLVNAANLLVESNDFNRKRASMLARMGYRRGDSFLTHAQKRLPPVFGFTNFGPLFSTLKGEEERIRILRSIASKHNLDANAVIIRYKYSNAAFEYATAIPITRSSTKRNSEGIEIPFSGHQRWIPAGHVSLVKTNCQCFDECEDECPCIIAKAQCSPQCHGPNLITCTNIEFDFTQMRIESIHDTGDICTTFDKIDLNAADNEMQFSWYDAPISTRATRPTNTSGRTTYDPDILDGSPWSSQQATHFTFLLGDPQTAAIFIRLDQKIPREITPNEMDIEYLIESFESDAVEIGTLIEYLQLLGKTNHWKGYFRSLKALASAADIYKLLPNTTVAFSLISQTLHESHWIPLKSQDPGELHLETLLKPFPLDRPSTLACVVMFETGSWNIAPESFENVMAISSGDSIYVAAPLLCDPYESPRGNELKRIIGNVGRAGIALLIPPRNVRTRGPLYNKWELVNHDIFDGKAENCFQNTSMHLSFTGYEIPVGVAPQGFQDREIMAIETLISVHDRGKWVGDLDVLSIFTSDYFHRMHLHDCAHMQATELQLNPVSIDCWEELIDKPDKPGIFRAHENWLARLAGATMSIQLQHHTIILPRSVCWFCCILMAHEKIAPDDLASAMFIY
ncbi:hypothetical protein GP486_000743 [Trichoglossum hirsutum]|uniref:Uncharacterized protein n=1 Tax=Trichoglossum hirsutum TaxID=265104 RepID=A0A9P8LI80_9PEZI|nr:hypothetical protein GP486_000743 [Trichoglossum hirsutum]